MSEPEEIVKEVSDFVDDTPVVETPASEVPPEAPHAAEPPSPEVPPAAIPPAEPAAEPPKVEPPKSEPPVIPPVTPPVVEPPVKTKEQELEDALASARLEIEGLSKRIASPEPPPQQEVKKDAQGNIIPPTPQKIEPFQFVKDDAEFDEALKSSDNFNKLLTGVMYKAIESTLRVVPKLVVNLADQQITTRSAIQEFYTENKDLLPNKAYVGVIADELAAKNPTWKLDELLKNLGGEVRSRLKLTAPGSAPIVPPINTPPPNTPAFAGGGGGGGNRGGGGTPSALQKDINDLISD
jgi:hypothetical protein